MGIYNRYANIKIARPDENVFPRWIDHNGCSYLVHNERDIAEVMQPVLEQDPKGFGESVGTKEQYKAALLQEALDLGIPAKKTWGIEKLRKAIHSHDNRE